MIFPLFKNGDNTNPKNYRSILQLNLFAKLFEKLMHKRLISYISYNNVIFNEQFGLRQRLNTTDTAAEYLNHV